MEYLTNEKKEELEKELNQLKTVRRKEIAEALEYSKSLGDLSENAEYHQAREDQANCEDRISYLEEILKNVVIMDKSTGGNIFVGTTVKLTKKGEKNCNVNGHRQSFNRSKKNVFTYIARLDLSAWVKLQILH